MMLQSFQRFNKLSWVFRFFRSLKNMLIHGLCVSFKTTALYLRTILIIWIPATTATISTKTVWWCGFLRCIRCAISGGSNIICRRHCGWCIGTHGFVLLSAVGNSFYRSGITIKKCKFLFSESHSSTYYKHSKIKHDALQPYIFWFYNKYILLGKQSFFLYQVPIATIIQHP